MSALVIPRRLPDACRGSEFHEERYRRKRKEILHELRSLSGVPEVLRALRPNDTYRIVCAPAGGKLPQGTDGLYSGVFYKDGKILKHAKLQRVGPSLVKCATAIGSQILLISIAMQLNRVEKGIDDILAGLHGDRMAEIAGGRKQYDFAKGAESRQNQVQLIANAIQSLTVGIEKALMALPGHIEKMPDTEIRVGDNWPLFSKSLTETARFRFKPVQETFWACVVGIQTLAECYAALDEPDLGARVLREFTAKLESGTVMETMLRKARLVPVEGGRFAEDPLRDFLEYSPLLAKQLMECHELAEGHIESIEVELKPNELVALKAVR